MKRITVILALTMLAAVAASPLMAAGVPPAINLQGRLTDGAGSNLPDGAYSVLFRIYDDPIAGNMLWSETLPVQVTGGLFTVLVGNSTAIPADIFSNGANRHLGVTVSPEPEMPRIPLNSVAYAYQTQDADVATLALDLTCVGCVSAGDIATNAVGALEIGPDAVVGGFHGDIADETITSDDLADRSVGSSEIDVAAVTTSEVLNGSLLAVDIGDEPGVASNTTDAGFALDGTIQTLLSRTITAPAAGHVLAIATAQVTVTHTNGTTSFAGFGVSTTAGVFPANQDVLVQVSSAAPSGIYSQAVTVHGLFSTSGGADDFFFLGDEGAGIVSAADIQFTPIYFPTAHGTVVSTAAPSGGEIISYESVVTPPKGAETGLVLPETGSSAALTAGGEPVPAQVATPAGLQPDLAQAVVEMEARLLKKLEEKLRQTQPGADEKE